MTPPERTPPSERTALYDLPCRDCGIVVRVRLKTGARGAGVPVFCNACLTARIKDIQAERRPRRRPVTQERKTA